MLYLRHCISIVCHGLVPDANLYLCRAKFCGPQLHQVVLGKLPCHLSITKITSEGDI
jgi:hypothetical protein